MMNGESPARILVVGVGGGGGNAVNRMFRAGLRGVELVAMNTDVQVLSLVQAHKHLQLGPRLTGGLGAGGDPEVGKKAAEESREDIADILEGADMVFITAGMGGGTGTGGAPVVAEVAKELGILTVAIVTRPFSFEGPARAQKAEMGIQRLSKVVDALITIANDKLLKIAPPDMPLTKAFELADEVLHQGVQGVTELVTVPGLINLDFADLEAVLRGAGTASWESARLRAKTAPGKPLAGLSPRPFWISASRTQRRLSSTSPAARTSPWRTWSLPPASCAKPSRTAPISSLAPPSGKGSIARELR